MASMSEWSFNAAAGTWTVGPDNNFALNPTFEADRVAMTQPAGWTTSTTTGGGITPYTNVSGGHTGNWAWQLTSTGAYQATLNQAVTGLPNGTYTLSVWAKSTGGQTTANLYASGYGGAEKDASLTKAMTRLDAGVDHRHRGHATAPARSASPRPPAPTSRSRSTTSPS